MPLTKISLNKVKLVGDRILRRLDRSVSGSCAILLYHRVADVPFDPQLLAVHPDVFYEHLTCLKNEYTLLCVDEFVSIKKSRKKFPPRSVLLTFDDGYSDNYFEALPILKSVATQGLFYITTGNIDSGKEFWWDILERILLMNAPRNLPKDFSILGRVYKSGSTEQALQTYECLMWVFKSMAPVLRDRIIDQLTIDFNSTITRNTHRPLTWDELFHFSKSNTTVIGAHTVNHPSLAALTFSEQQDEILGSVIKLRSKLETDIFHFSYPFGSAVDYNEDSIRIVKDLGLKMVCANQPELIFSGSDEFSLPRFLVRNWDLNTFRNQLKSFFN